MKCGFALRACFKQSVSFDKRPARFAGKWETSHPRDGLNKKAPPSDGRNLYLSGILEKQRHCRRKRRAIVPPQPPGDAGRQRGEKTTASPSASNNQVNGSGTAIAKAVSIVVMPVAE